MTCKIRASSLPMYNDCPRRNIARILRNMLEEMGYKLRNQLPMAGTAIGVGKHSGIAHILKNKKRTGELGNLK